MWQVEIFTGVPTDVKKEMNKWFASIKYMNGDEAPIISQSSTGHHVVVTVVYWQEKTT